MFEITDVSMKFIKTILGSNIKEKEERKKKGMQLILILYLTSIDKCQNKFRLFFRLHLKTVS